MADLYICSTLRHLLFSVSRASEKPDKKSIILFFADYQNVDSNRISTSTPENIDLRILSRKALNKTLRSSISGRLISAAAMRELQLPQTILPKIIKRISEITQISQATLTDCNLFLFNDKNKMSRLFKVIKSQYQIIEDGVGNYYNIPRKGIKKYIAPLNINGDNFWVMGDNPRCTKVNVVFPENLPPKVKSKGHKIEFLGKKAHLPTINSIFKFEPMIKDDKVVVIATQPISKELVEKVNDSNYLLSLHKTIANHFDAIGVSYYIKLHPSENIQDYLPYFDESKFLSVKHPLELELLNYKGKITVVSLCSSAGLGFEHFCTRKKLIHDDEMSNFVKILTDWFHYPEHITERITEVFTDI